MKIRFSSERTYPETDDRQNDPPLFACTATDAETSSQIPSSSRPIAPSKDQCSIETPVKHADVRTNVSADAMQTGRQKDALGLSPLEQLPCVNIGLAVTPARDIHAERGFGCRDGAAVRDAVAVWVFVCRSIVDGESGLKFWYWRIWGRRDGSAGC